MATIRIILLLVAYKNYSILTQSFKYDSFGMSLY